MIFTPFGPPIINPLAKQTMNTQRHFFILDSDYLEIKHSIEMGYNQIKIGMITKKTKGVCLCNENYEVRGTYPLEFLPAIEMILAESL